MYDKIFKKTSEFSPRASKLTLLDLFTYFFNASFNLAKLYIFLQKHRKPLMETDGKYFVFLFFSLKTYLNTFLPVVDAYQIFPRMHTV